MTQVVPAIIPKTFLHLGEEVDKVKDYASLVQVDITDGVFTKNTTWPYVGDMGEFANLVEEELGLPSWEDMDYEIHLMVEHPETVVEDWVKAGASSIVVQIETVTEESMETIIAVCKAAEAMLGVAIKPSTQTGRLAPYGDRIDFIQCMGSDDLGYHGAELNPTIFERLKELRTIYPDMTLAVDIGVSEDTAAELVHAGATKLVAGHAIFENGNIEEAIEGLEK
jgi:ribulose-phosphate 3-epimerase